MPAPSFQELTAALAGLGWTLDGVEQPSKNTPKYVATATGPDGAKKVVRDGDTPEFALGNIVAFAQRHNKIRANAAMEKTSAWDLPWENQLEDIGKAYGELPVFDPKAVPHWQALAQESKHQADAIRKQLKVNVTDDPEPYPHVGAMIHDIHHKGKFSVSRAHSDHPIWSVPDNVNFRIVHDVLGHGQTGGDFGWQGENKACGIHFPMVSKMARPALFTECIGQTAYALRKGSHGFGQQKIGIMPQFLEPVEKLNGEHVYIPHGKFAYPEEIDGGGNAAAWGWYQDPQTGIWKQDENAGDASEQRASHVRERIVLADASTDLLDPETGANLWDDNHQMFRGEDPNHTYTTPTDVTQRGVGGGGSHPDFNGDQVLAGTQSDWLDRTGTYNNTAKMVVPWWERDSNGAWKYPVADQERIIMNAFRLCMLSPLKNLKWNFAHYQGIMDMPVTATGREMWDKLDNTRRQWNKNQGFDEDEHLGYYKEIKVLAGYIQYETGDHKQEALKQAKQQVYAKVTEFEQQLTAQHDQGTLKLEGTPGEWAGEDEDTDEDGITPLRIYLTAHQMVDEWLRGVLAERSPESHADRPEHEQMALASLRKQANQLGLEGVEPTRQKGTKKEKYAGFMGQHLDNIAKIAPMLPEIRAAALKDIYTDGGRGFIFRNAILNLKREHGLTGLNPKVISFIWLLMYPEGSDLGIVDTHVARAFNRNYNDVGSVKDYYKVERMQKAVKDASGYPDMPLGTFHHGMWDVVRSKDWRKGVTHSDHSPGAIDQPEPWDQHPYDMDTGNAKMGNWVGPDPFEHARPLAEDVAGRYEAQFAGQAKNRIPYSVLEDMGAQKAANFDPSLFAPTAPAFLKPLALWVQTQIAQGGWGDANTGMNISAWITAFWQAMGILKKHNDKVRATELLVSKGVPREVAPQVIEKLEGQLGSPSSYDLPYAKTMEQVSQMPEGQKAASPQINFGDGSQAGDWGLDDDDFEDFAAYHNNYGRDRGELSELPPEETDRLKAAWESRTAAADPDWTFVYYQGGLVVEPHADHPNVKNMADRLLKDFGYPNAEHANNGPGTSDMKDWSAGDVWGKGEHIQITQLSDADVADDARQAVRAYFDADTEPDGHAVVVAPDDGEWEVQAPPEKTSALTPEDRAALIAQHAKRVIKCKVCGQKYRANDEAAVQEHQHKTAGWIPMEHGSPHGGPANTGDVVCPECNNRIIGPTCSKCGHRVDGSEQPVIAGPYDPERADMREATQHDPAAEEALDWDMEEEPSEDWELA